jgi:hypothetical protein
MSKAEYVDLLTNPERYTGYVAPHAHKIWNSIYRENCFDERQILTKIFKFFFKFIINTYFLKTLIENFIDQLMDQITVIITNHSSFNFLTLYSS